MFDNLLLIASFIAGWGGCVLWNAFWFHVANRAEDLRHTQAMNAARESEAQAEAEKKWNEAQAIGPKIYEPDELQADILRDRWLTVWDIVLRSGDAVGWTSRAMVPGCIRKPADWQMLTDYLVEHGILSKDSNSPTAWAAGMDALTAYDRLKGLPCPTFKLPGASLIGNASRLKASVNAGNAGEGG